MTTDGENETTDGETMTTTGENVATFGENMATTGENMATTGENMATTGENMATDGENVATDGENVATDGGNRASAETDGSTDSREEILDATYRVLCERGYANLTMQRIADEAGTSKSLLHYHFDTKDELLLAFLDRFLDKLDDVVAELEGEDPAARLEAFVDRFVIDPDDEDRQAFWLGFLEMRLRAAHDEQFREQLSTNTEAILRVLSEIIEEGIAEGQFRPVDARATAELIYGALEGARTRQATLGADEASRTVGDAITERVIEHLRIDADE